MTGLSNALKELAQVSERLRIANWLEQRAQLIMPHDREGALELCICAKAIRQNELGPLGMHGREPILKTLKKDMP